jgi:acyl-CoA synthetase (AMP-forming)/AMP-acid ligase II
VIESSIPAVLRERASLQPNDIAYTYLNCDDNPAGIAENLTWGQLYKRSVALAYELRQLADIGDRVVILAPQTLEYVLGFVAALQANLIAVPLSTPIVGAHDERVTAVLRDAAPKVILTTTAIADSVSPYAAAAECDVTVLAVDALDLDTRRGSLKGREARPDTAYLQYTSGSTRTPAGVQVSHRNLSANYEQMVTYFFPHYGKVPPPDTHVVSWLPFYHDMGLLLGVCAPILGGWKTVFISPLQFLVRPARWMQMLGTYPSAISAAPNFAFDLATARTTDEDMAGMDLSRILAIMSGAERVQPTTVRRFTQRFAKYGLDPSVIRPSYGLAEATLYVATRKQGEPPSVVHFEPEKLSDGQAERSASGTPLISYGIPDNPLVKIVDPDTGVECAAGTVGEIWTRGENICAGYWNKPEETELTFGGVLQNAGPDAADKKWLRTGDLGFISDGELFIVGRRKDLLIVRGRNLYPDDIESVVSAISGGRVAAISVDIEHAEQLVAIIEVKQHGDTEDEVAEHLAKIRNDATAAISQSFGVTAADLVLAPPGAIPITTSGKIRRQACADLYRRGAFVRMDA